MTIIEATAKALNHNESKALNNLLNGLEKRYYGGEMVFVKEESVNFIEEVDFSQVVKTTKAYQNSWKDSYFTDRFVKGGRHETAIRVRDLIRALNEVYQTIGNK